MEAFAPGAVSEPPAVERPRVRLAVGHDLGRSRLTVLFRPLLAYPLGCYAGLWGIVALLAAPFQWVYTLAAGQPQRHLHAFLTRFVRFYAHMSAYLRFLANPFPHFVGDPGDYPVDLEVDRPARQRRWTVALRLILGIPAVVISYVFQVISLVLWIVGWIVCLVLGRMPKGLNDLAAFLLRYESCTAAYVLLLDDRFPALSPPPTKETVIERPARRWNATYL